MVWVRVAVGVAAALVTAGVAYWKKDEVKTLWDDIVLSLKGKKVAVLGARGVGKTTLLGFLSKGELPSEYIQTLVTESVKGNRFSMADLKLDLKETSDVSGGHDAVEEWRRIHNASEIILYLVNASDLDRRRLERDLGKIESWRKECAKKPKLLVIVTHLDLDPEYVKTPSSKRGDYRDRFVKEHMDAGLSGLSERPQIIMGSLKDRDSAARVVADLIKLVST
ncbi:ADP-ribosylation factor-like protein [Pseudomonas aeruginosa]|uniref:ADP-ribosylation factor-like protein n=1 Tax=Pseudomonas aeruginosa TaxID=287 RepID=UPI00405478FB